MSKVQHVRVETITRHTKNHQSWVTLPIDRTINPAFCFALCLMERDLSDALHLIGAKNDPQLFITKSADADRKTPRGVFEWRETVCMLEITPTELGCWTRFFLEYERDGIASVSHIDVETKNLVTGETLDFVLETDLSPMSPDELRRRFSAP